MARGEPLLTTLAGYFAFPVKVTGSQLPDCVIRPVLEVFAGAVLALQEAAATTIERLVTAVRPTATL